MPPEKTYAEVVEEQRRALGQAALNDPLSHFPYKRAVVDGMLATPNLPMGSGRPAGLEGAEDTSRTIEDYMSPGIAEATDAYIAAQAAHLANPDDEATFDAYNAARDQLQAARLDHRQNRGESFVIGAAARRAG